MDGITTTDTIAVIEPPCCARKAPHVHMAPVGLTFEGEKVGPPPEHFSDEDLKQIDEVWEKLATETTEDTEDESETSE